MFNYYKKKSILSFSSYLQEKKTIEKDPAEGYIGSDRNNSL